MGIYQLIHLNVVRPLGQFSTEREEAKYFFSQLPTIFADAGRDEGPRWHNHGIRLADGSYLDLPEIFNLHTEGDQNPHIMTMAGWEDAKAMHRFAYRMRSHAGGMKQLRHWVDRSEGATMVMFWAERSKRVGLEEAWDRLQKLRSDGPTPEAFSLQQRFDAPDSGCSEAA